MGVRYGATLPAKGAIDSRLTRQLNSESRQSRAERFGVFCYCDGMIGDIEFMHESRE